MPSRSPNAHFLGIELATDQLRASVVDEQLDLVGVECVDFDSELPEFQYVFALVLTDVELIFRCRTHGGIFTTPGDAYTTPVEMWIKAIGTQTRKFRAGTVLMRWTRRQISCWPSCARILIFPRSRASGAQRR